ncbi:hypothetical protein Tco_1169741, partial [Tanacetum coccineum]
KHLHAVKRIFRYLRGTVNRGLWYSKDSAIALTAFADADHVGCQDEVNLEVCNCWETNLSAGQQKAKKALQYLVRKLNTSPYPAIVLKSFGCDHSLPTMALDSTKFQCTVIIKALLPYAATMFNTLDQSISTADITS